MVLLKQIHRDVVLDAQPEFVAAVPEIVVSELGVCRAHEAVSAGEGEVVLHPQLQAAADLPRDAERIARRVRGKAGGLDDLPLVIRDAKPRADEGLEMVPPQVEIVIDIGHVKPRRQAAAQVGRAGAGEIDAVEVAFMVGHLALHPPLLVQPQADGPGERRRVVVFEIPGARRAAFLEIAFVVHVQAHIAGKINPAGLRQRTARDGHKAHASQKKQ